ncbi:MAG: hypothetical protein M3Z35_16740 [Nitrospirota bacterium]|nr:hypothetical protein [Nitrospirota bacterium]
MAQWTSPDPYAGDVHDPMSQKPFMWNKNNPLIYSDPSGYDTITMIARDAADSLLFEHVYIQVKKDDGKIVRYSFGPLKNGNQATKSPLVRKDNKMDAPYDNNNYGSKTLAKCNGICTVKQGGFDESSLARTAEQIQALHLTYGFPQPNSNSATYTLCVDGGGGAQCNNPPGWAISPGWGRNLNAPAKSIGS